MSATEKPGLFVPARSTTWKNGEPLSTAFSFSTSRARETDTPERTSAIAALRLAGGTRLSAPSWSSAPQRPQFESSTRAFSKSGRPQAGAVRAAS